MIFGKQIDLKPVQVSDAEFILSLRLDPKLNQYISPVENDINKQREWIAKSINNDSEWYFIVQNKQAEPIGTIRIYDIQGDSFCWGSWIIKPEARHYASFESLVLVHEYAFFELGFSSARADARQNNSKSVNFQLRFGARIIEKDGVNFYFLMTKEEYLLVRENYLSIITNKNLT